MDTDKALGAALPQIVETFQQLVEKLRTAIRVLRDRLNAFMDGLLYMANDHPKWWHLYRHAKRWRIRKKYRKKLMAQLLRKMEAAAAT